jgi:hypothetical protein
VVEIAVVRIAGAAWNNHRMEEDSVGPCVYTHLITTPVSTSLALQQVRGNPFSVLNPLEEPAIDGCPERAAKPKKKSERNGHGVGVEFRCDWVARLSLTPTRLRHRYFVSLGLVGVHA